MDKNDDCVMFDPDAIKEPNIIHDKAGVQKHIKDLCLKHEGKKYFLAPFLMSSR